MRDLIVGTLGAIVFFTILYMPLDNEAKNLVAGIACVAIISFYIIRAVMMPGRIDWLRVFTIICPTIALVIILVVNLIYQLEIGWLYLWGGYALLTAIALKISTKIGHVQ